LIFSETALPGAFRIDLEPLLDARGFFARSFCTAEFEAHGLNPACIQCNISFNRRRGTLRGMHFQHPPHDEAKLVRCTQGAIHDVIIDLRPDSPTCRQYLALELTAENHRMLYVPPGFAHGFQTLAENTEVFYQMSAAYQPAAATGLRYNDPAFQIPWPLPIAEISERDRTYPDYPNPNPNPNRNRNPATRGREDDYDYD
jgi:dTDP-4-dehydrorhamnose 3,5-epimerase